MYTFYTLCLELFFFSLILHDFSICVVVGSLSYFNTTWYRQVIWGSIPYEFRNCSFCILHQEHLIDDATSALLEVLEPQDKFLLSFSYPNLTTRIRDVVDVHKLRDRCIISFIQVSNLDALQANNSAPTVDFLYKIIHNMEGIIKKDEDYFIFHSLEGRNIDTLFSTGLVATNVKNKLGIRLESSEMNTHNPNVSLYTTCLYCANGQPMLYMINTPSHNSESFHLSSSVHILFPDLLKNFHGKEFTVSTPILARWLIEIRESSPGYWRIRRGVMNSAFVHVMWKYNFTARYFPSVGGGGTGYRFSNGTWIGTVGDVLSGRAEIGHTTGQIYNRNKVAGFSFPIGYEWLTFTTGEPQPTYSWKSVYWPFTPFLWLAVIGSVVIAFFALTFLLKVSNEQEGSPSKVAATYLLRSFLEQDGKILETRPRNSTRTFITFWLIFSLLITTAYRSKLVSFLAFPNVEEPPETFEALAKSDHFQIALQYLRGAAYSLIKTSTNPTFQTIFNRMELIENDAKCFQRAIEQPHFSCISWESITHFVYHKNLSDKHGYVPMIRARDTTSFIVVGLTFPKRAVFRLKFDSVIIRASDMGLMRKWIDLDNEFIRTERIKWEKATNKPPVTYEKDANDALKVQNLSGTFLILSVGFTFGILTFLTEFFIWKIITCKGQGNNGAVDLLLKDKMITSTPSLLKNDLFIH